MTRHVTSRSRIPFRIAGAIGPVPVVPVAAMVGTLVMIPQLHLTSLAIGGGIAVAGAVVAMFSRRRRPPARGD